MSLGRQAAASGAALRGEDGGSGAACLSLMAAVLGWDFQHSNNARTNIVQAQVCVRGPSVFQCAVLQQRVLGGLRGHDSAAQPWLLQPGS